MANDWTLRGNLRGPKGDPGDPADISAHEAADDPHPVYLTQTEADALYGGGGGGTSAWVSIDDQPANNDEAIRLQAAIDSLPTAGGTVVIPARDAARIFTASVTLRSNVRIIGQGIDASVIHCYAAAPFTWNEELYNFTMEHITIIGAGGSGHMFSPSSGAYGLVHSRFTNCTLMQLEPTASIMRCDGDHNYVHNVVDQCQLIRTGSSTTPGWYIRNGYGGANANTFRDVWIHSNNATSTPFVEWRNVGAANYAYDNVFTNIVGEQNCGGLIHAYSALGWVFDKVTDWDASGYTDDIIRIGKDPASIISRAITLRDCGRRGSTLGPGVYDVNIVPNEAYGCTIIQQAYSSGPSTMQYPPDTIVIGSGKILGPVPNSLAAVADGGTIAIDASVAPVQRIIAAGAGATLAAPTNPIDGVPLNVEVSTNPALSLTIDPAIINCSGLDSPIAVGAGKRCFLGLRPVGTTWYLLAVSVQP